MQRIQSWFDQLTINRQSRRNSRRRNGNHRGSSPHRSRQYNDGTTSTSMGWKPANSPARRYAQPVRASSHSVVRRSRDELKPLPVCIAFPPPPPIPPPSSCSTSHNNNNNNQIGSFPRRNRIRTNPWVGESRMWDSMISSGSMGRSMTDSMNNSPPNVCVASPDTSMCSSGYASHDSSPDTSMVWSNSGEWKNYDNTNIYHELMITNHSKMSSSSSCSLNLQPTPSPKRDESSRVESPIYAEPWTQYHNHLPTSSGGLVVRNCAYRPPSPIYSQPFSELVSPRKRMDLKELTDDELARDEYLYELDQQIHELQMRSEELRGMVERARQSRKEYLIPKMECTFELSI